MLVKTPVFLSAEWRSLVMLNYEVDPGILLPLVPAGTELDVWEGRALVSMVGFMFLNTRVLGVPIPFHCNFEEVNLRFYVRRKSSDEFRRGVSFIREIVPRAAIAWTARAIYNEPYLARPMRHLVTETEFEYSWHSGKRWHSLAARVSGAPQPLVAGSEEEFITEHYWGYTAQRDGGTVEYSVQHPAWRVWRAESAKFDCDIEAIYGRAFVEPLSGPPRSAFVAEGSPVTVHKATRL